MKLGTLITCTLALTCPIFAQDKDNKEALPQASAKMNPEEADALLKKLSQDFENLPKDKRIEYLEMRNEAAHLFQNKRIFEALDLIRKMSVIFKDDPQLFVLKGACYVEIRDFKSAREAFNDAVKIVGPRYNILFNLAEIDFVTNKWQEALNGFERIKGDIPNKDVAMQRLVDFKIMLCHIRLAEDKALKEDVRKQHEAQIAEYAKKQDFMDDSPYHYYANAAYSYYKGNTEQADQWLAKGRRVFQQSPVHIASWEDTLVEFGYIKSYFGDEDESADTSE